MLLKVGDDVSTDEISPAGARALPFRSNIPKLAQFTFTPIDPDYPRKAAELAHTSGNVVIGGHNYGQGFSREHAAITLRYLGLHAVIAKSFARIHWQNLANFGILALEFTTEDDYDRIEAGHTLLINGLREVIGSGDDLTVTNISKDEQYPVHHRLSPRQIEMVLAGGQIPLLAQGHNPQSIGTPAIAHWRQERVGLDNPGAGRPHGGSERCIHGVAVADRPRPPAAEDRARFQWARAPCTAAMNTCCAKP